MWPAGVLLTIVLIFIRSANGQKEDFKELSENDNISTIMNDLEFVPRY